MLPRSNNYLTQPSSSCSAYSRDSHFSSKHSSRYISKDSDLLLAAASSLSTGPNCNVEVCMYCKDCSRYLRFHLGDACKESSFNNKLPEKGRSANRNANKVVCSGVKPESPRKPGQHGDQPLVVSAKDVHRIASNVDKPKGRQRIAPVKNGKPGRPSTKLGVTKMGARKTTARKTVADAAAQPKRMTKSKPNK